jgi:predicted DNA-binding protein (UPF0278 family)
MGNLYGKNKSSYLATKSKEETKKEVVSLNRQYRKCVKQGILSNSLV